VPGDFDDEIKISPPLQIRQTTGNPFGCTHRPGHANSHRGEKAGGISCWMDHGGPCGQASA
jgi:hypothetical protein